MSSSKKKQHTVLLTLTERGKVVPMSEEGKAAPGLRVRIGDKIRWITEDKDAKVGIKFRGLSPFHSAACPNWKYFRIVTAKNEKTVEFKYRCTVTKDGITHSDANDGGSVVVGGSKRTT
jgi:hypothetical protein